MMKTVKKMSCLGVSLLFILVGFNVLNLHAQTPPKPAEENKKVPVDTWQPDFKRGDYSFDATMENVIAREKPDANVVALGEIKGISLPDNDDMLVWTLKDIEPGDYYIGLVASFTRDTVFLNGRALQFETGSEAYILNGTPRLREWVTA